MGFLGSLLHGPCGESETARPSQAGLRSVHVKAGPPAASKESELLLISPEDAATAHFAEGQQVIVEKIM